jgi:hypothetical protein
MAEKINIYILALSNGKYYVGKSANVSERYRQHLSGRGSAWTKKYKPVQVLRIIPNASPFEEDRYVKEYMSKFGIDNVRGGTYVSEVLNDQEMDTLNKEIWAATDKCTTCGRTGHWAKDCYAKTDMAGNTIEYDEDLDEVWECVNCKKEFSNEEECDEHERKCSRKKIDGKKKGACYRCGRAGHYSPDCYARSHKDGYDLSDDEDDSD